MTTIAYRAGIIAADMMVSSTDGSFVGTAVKIGQRGSLLYGGAGGIGLVQEFLQWMERGDPNEACPDLGNWDKEYARCIVIKGTEIFTHHPTGFDRMTSEYYAIGSGRELAMGAMAHGASAAEAVKAAMKHDLATGGEIMWLARPEESINQAAKAE